MPDIKSGVGMLINQCLLAKMWLVLTGGVRAMRGVFGELGRAGLLEAVFLKELFEFFEEFLWHADIEDDWGFVVEFFGALAGADIHHFTDNVVAVLRGRFFNEFANRIDEGRFEVELRFEFKMMFFEHAFGDKLIEQGVDGFDFFLKSG